MAYIGKEPIVGNFQKCDALTASATADYTLQVSSTNVVPESANHMLVSLNGILQAPITSFTVSGSTLSFASALTSSDSIDFVILLGNVLDIGTPSDGTVTSAKLVYPLTTFSSTGIDDNADATAITIDSSERVGIGVASPAELLDIASSVTTKVKAKTTTSTALGGFEAHGDASSYLKVFQYGSSAGGTTFGGVTGDNQALIEAQAVSSVVFSTQGNDGGSNPDFIFAPQRTAKFIIKDGGKIGIGTSSPGGFLHINHDASSEPLLRLQESTSTSARSAVNFRNPNGLIGSISLSGSATAYNTSSDYRLKENVSYNFDATTRLKQLKPARFNFIVNADKTVDGFLAHEVSDIVPEAIIGEKDAMIPEVLYADEVLYTEEVLYTTDDELPEGKEIGDIKYAIGDMKIPADELPEGKNFGDVKEETKINPQGIDQSKLVPLLVKTIQELEARITTLENA
jgi:hypothetical protein